MSSRPINLVDTSEPRPGGQDLLWFIAQGTAGTVGEEFFQCLVKHAALAFRADVAFVAEWSPSGATPRFLACWEGTAFAEPVEYCMGGTQCAEVGDADLVSYPQGVIERFPEDEMVLELGLDSYRGVALRGSDGAHLGHLGVLAAAPLDPDEENLAAPNAKHLGPANARSPLVPSSSPMWPSRSRRRPTTSSPRR